MRTPPILTAVLFSLLPHLTTTFTPPPPMLLSTQLASAKPQRISASISALSSASSSLPAPTTAPTLLNRLTNPLYYPWNADKLAANKSRRLRRDAQTLYRQLGVSESASYEQINAAYDALLTKYADDVKAKMRLGVVKDKIMSIRLKQRVAGSLKVDGEAREMDILSDKVVEMAKSKKKLQPPKWMGSLAVLPDKKWAVKNAKFMGGTSLGCIFLPNMASSFIMLACMCSIGLLYSRGQPETVMDDMGMPGEVRPTSPLAVGLTCGLCFGWAALAAIAFTLIAAASPVKILPDNMAVNLGVNLGFFIASTFFQTYQGSGGGGGGGKKKWGKNKGK